MHRSNNKRLTVAVRLLSSRNQIEKHYLAEAQTLRNDTTYPPLNQRNNQIKLAVLLIIISIPMGIFGSTEILDFVSGACFGIAFGLGIAAMSRLKVWPEKQV